MDTRRRRPQAHRARLAGNHVRGDAAAAIGQRGDTIRLWETDDAVVEGNLIEDGRDMVVWYSRGAAVRGFRTGWTYDRTAERGLFNF